jgi:hypothetical protein
VRENSCKNRNRGVNEQKGYLLLAQIAIKKK